MITGLVRRLYPDGPIENSRRPLIGLATDEAVELVETGMGRPTIERSRNRNLPRRRFVIFAKGGGAVAVESQHFCKRRHTLRTDSGITWKCGREFHDRASIVHVMIASRYQRRARRRTRRGGMKAVLTEACG